MTRPVLNMMGGHAGLLARFIFNFYMAAPCSRCPFMSTICWSDLALHFLPLAYEIRLTLVDQILTATPPPPYDCTPTIYRRWAVTRATVYVPLYTVPETIKSLEHGPRGPKPRLVGHSNMDDAAILPSFFFDTPASELALRALCDRLQGTMASS